MPDFDDILDSFDDVGPRMGSPQRKLPNADAAFALSIISIVPGCFCGFFGIVIAIAGLVLALGAIKAYRQSPSLYFASGLKRAQQARLIAIIGIVASVLFLITSIFV